MNKLLKVIFFWLPYGIIWYLVNNRLGNTAASVFIYLVLHSFIHPSIHPVNNHTIFILF
jgi:hypothetical protein